MKKSIVILLVIVSIFLASCAPQVTVTSEVTVTLPPPTDTPIPTPTLHPQFIALQDQIAAAGERFTLSPDGTLQDGATAIPSLQVAPDGKVTITVNGEQVEIDPAIMHFDDEKGLSITGWDDEDGDGNFEPAETGLTPEQSARIAEHNTEWNGVLTINAENQFLNKAGEVIEGMVYDPAIDKINLTFYSDGLGREFTQTIDTDFIWFGLYEGKPVNVKNIVKAFTLGEDGQIERVMAQDDGGPTSVPLRTPAELNQMMLENHSDAPGANKETVGKMDELRGIARDQGIFVVGTNGFYYFKYNDLYAKLGTGNGWASNSVYIWDEETQEFENNEIATYRVTALDNYLDHSVGVVVWMGADGKLNVELVAGPTNIQNMVAQYDQKGSYEFGAYGRGD